MGNSISSSPKRCGSGPVLVEGCGENHHSPRRHSLKKIFFPEVSFSRSSSGSNRFNMHKPLCRFSRRRRRDSTLSDVSGIFKTAWPVKVCESLFLPEFKIKNEVERNFTVLQEIGRGAFSMVYRVEAVDSRQEYAMKVLTKAKVVQEESVIQVKEEALIQSSCGHHPFIAACVDYWQSRHCLYIVSEYVCGGELWHLLNQYRTLPEDLVRIYIAEIALAIDFLHNAGVIYRDLKLENVVLDLYGHVRLVDFGLSKRLKYGGHTSTLCGTLQFIAPEVFEQSYSHAVDWWSLGVVACLLINGQYPSVVQHRMAQIVNVEDSSAVALTASTPENGGSAAARDLMSRLLQPDPQQRLRSLLKLKTIAFFKGFSFEDVLAKKVAPNSLLPPIDSESSNDIFNDFDSCIIPS